MSNYYVPKYEPKAPYPVVLEAFDRKALKRVCEMHEEEFVYEYDMDFYAVEQSAPDDFFLFRDNGADILAVAHLDTVGLHFERTANFIDTAGGPVIYSRALDDRLGAYTILELLPKLGVNVDLLLTVGEESGRSTAGFFQPDKEYNWMIEFDRGGTDVVMYQYDDTETRQLVRATGARVGDGIFSDISYMSHLEIKGFNWGVGYQDYHGPRAHAYLDDYWMMVSYFLDFHEDNADTYLPHDKSMEYSQYGWGSWRSGDTHGLFDDDGQVLADNDDVLADIIASAEDDDIQADLDDFSDMHPDLVSDDFNVVNDHLTAQTD